MKKQEVAIGERMPGTKLRVLGPAGSDKHHKQLVWVRCEWEVDGKECGTEKTMRVSAIKHPPYTRKNGKSLVSNISCGCQSKLRCRLRWEGYARRLDPVVLEEIYIGHVASGKSFRQLARAFNLHSSVVSTAVRLYGEEKKNTSART